MGLLLHWWYANKQQLGRGSISKLPLQTLSILDVTALTSKQLSQALSLFDAMSKLRLLPLHEVDNDPARKELDQRFARDVLGMAPPVLADGGPLELLRMKLAREPSIRGHKS